MIRDGDPPIRAVIVMAGNPLLSIGGGDELADAFAELDLLVTIDFFRNATGERADYVLPVADWFEREDVNTFVQGTQVEPFVQWTPALVEPHGERRSERDIFAALGERLGLPAIFTPDTDMLAMLLDGALAAHDLSVDGLRRAERGVAVLPETEPGHFLDRVTADGTVDGAPEMFASARQRAADLFETFAAEPDDQLKLITRRTAHTINSAMQNVERLKRGAADNPLYLTSVDADRLGIRDGERVGVSNAFGALEANAKIDDTLRIGVVAMTHGFGNAGTAGMPIAQRYPGVNVNVLAPRGPGTFDPVSTMSQLTGIPVDVVAL